MEVNSEPIRSEPVSDLVNGTVKRHSWSLEKLKPKITGPISILQELLTGRVYYFTGSALM